VKTVLANLRKQREINCLQRVFGLALWAAAGTAGGARRGHRHGLSMPIFVALLRAVNVGGTGLLPMAELKALCVDAGFAQVQTYIASGNVVFRARSPAAKVKAALEARLQARAGKPVRVAIRTADEMEAVLQGNPFPGAPAKRVVAIFLDAPPPPDALDHARGLGAEELRLGVREIYVRYGEDMGRSKLDIPAARAGTARNMNTIARLVELARSR
jgi:uncharacterized protein (DUF1697 family)